MGNLKNWLTSIWSVILLISVLLFVFWSGPVFSASAIGHGRRLVVSYAFIPVAVATVLIWHISWEWATFAYYTLGIALIKMVITMGIFIGVEPRRALGNAKPIDAIVGAARQESKYRSMQTNRWGYLKGHAEPMDSTRNIVVVITNISSGKPLAHRTHDVTVAAESVSRSSVVASIGDSIRITNHDSQLHTFNVTGPNGALFQLPLAPDKSSAPQVLSREGQFVSHCSQGHENEQVNLVVFGHPYFTAVSSDGTFTIDSIPAGEYRVEMYNTSDAPIDGDAHQADYADFGVVAAETTIVRIVSGWR